MNAATATADSRARSARDWALQQLGLADAEFLPASADASFRRYFRVQQGPRSWIVMDAPPEREDCGPFVRVAGLMQAAGLNVPQVLAQDRERGFLLLGDLGRQTYLQVLNPNNADVLFENALGALIRWQRASRPDVLPAYDEALLRRELALFSEWFLGRHRGLGLSTVQQQALRGIEDALVASALAQAPVFVHRDFMPRNLMVAEPVGVLDFQDAVWGPASYDAVCLFRDAFISWPPARVQDWLRSYWRQALAASVPVAASFDDFSRQADWMGVQRHLKVLGIFARIRHRDGKPQYLEDAPRFIDYVREAALRHRPLAPLLRLFDELGLP